MTTKPRIYIAGKVTGTPIEETTNKFKSWKQAIESMGFEAVNPLEVVNNWNTPWEQAMRMCVAALVGCDAVFLLPDWMDSRGALIEQRIAQEMGIPTFEGDKQLKERICSHPKINLQ
jgi:hypothetical protein